jgi:hypothetical protein
MKIIEIDIEITFVYRNITTSLKSPTSEPARSKMPQVFMITMRFDRRLFNGFSKQKLSHPLRSRSRVIYR